MRVAPTGEGPQPAITLADEAITSLRAQVHSLLGLTDTARRPAPAGIIPPGKRNPGAVWKPLAKWSVRTISDDADSGEYIYVTTSQHWGGDFEAMPLEEARVLAMSLLAACEWAEKNEPADRRRYPELDFDHDADAILPTGRMFVCGPMPDRQR